MLKWEDFNESITNICTAVQKLQVFLEQGTSAHPISPSMQWIMHHEEPEQICHAGSSNMQLHSGRYWKMSSSQHPNVHSTPRSITQRPCASFSVFIIRWALNTVFHYWTLYQKYYKYDRHLSYFCCPKLPAELLSWKCRVLFLFFLLTGTPILPILSLSGTKKPKCSSQPSALGSVFPYINVFQWW